HRSKTQRSDATVRHLVPRVRHQPSEVTDMSQYFINGAKYSFSTTLAAEVAISAITNGNPAVATAVSPPQEGDIVLLKSNWTELNELAVYADNVVGNAFDLARLDILDETLFPEDEETPASYQVV